jgi:uncharacterized membrane protein
VSSESGAPTQVRQSSSNGNTELRIGDPERTVTGEQQYTLDYTLQNVITFYSDHDELYWDVNGDQWSQPFGSVHVDLHVPPGTLNGTAPICITGSYGSTEAKCTSTVRGDTISVDSADLLPHQTLTYVTAFKKNYFHPVTIWQRLTDYYKIILALVLPPLITFIVCFSWWWRKGRDAAGRGTIVPEYSPPKDLSPLEAGAVSDVKVDNRDITATIIDLARRGYLTITEIKKDRILLKDTTTYMLTLKNTDYSTLDVNEQVLLNALFTDKESGKEV